MASCFQVRKPREMIQPNPGCTVSLWWGQSSRAGRSLQAVLLTAQILHSSVPVSPLGALPMINCLYILSVEPDLFFLFFLILVAMVLGKIKEVSRLVQKSENWQGVSVVSIIHWPYQVFSQILMFWIPSTIL